MNENEKQTYTKTEEKGDLEEKIDGLTWPNYSKATSHYLLILFRICSVHFRTFGTPFTRYQILTR